MWIRELKSPVYTTVKKQTTKLLSNVNPPPPKINNLENIFIGVEK